MTGAGESVAGLDNPGVVDGASKEPDGSDGEVTGAGESVAGLGAPVFLTVVPDGFAAKAGEPEGPTGTELGEPGV